MENIYDELRQISNSIVELKTNISYITSDIAQIKSKIDNLMPRVQALENNKKDMKEFEQELDRKQSRITTYIFLLFTAINLAIAIIFKII